MSIPLRILCLHDANSDAAQLKNELSLLGERLYTKHGEIDLVYVNSPIALPEEGKRIWFDCHENDDTSDTSETSSIPSFRGLDASLLLLKQIWLSTPFWGILGVGQGASVAALLTLLIPAMNQENPSNSVIPPPSFAIFVGARQPLLRDTEKLVVDGALACLHVHHGESCHADETLLVQQFGGTIVNHGAHKDVLNALGRFICEQRKHLLSNHHDMEVVALQTALHVTEQEAADKIARHIAKNPPAALMAVIRPNDVAGWSGNKRRQPGEEGGGAPCPSEFLLKREKRENRENGEGSASRAHPKQEQTR